MGINWSELQRSCFALGMALGAAAVSASHHIQSDLVLDNFACFELRLDCRQIARDRLAVCCKVFHDDTKMSRLFLEEGVAVKLGHQLWTMIGLFRIGSMFMSLIKASLLPIWMLL